MTTPNLQLTEMPGNSLQPSSPFNASMQALDALVQLSVETITATPPTTTSADVGKRWIVGTGATGVWAGKDNQIALCTAADTWTYYVPQEGWRADVKDVDLQHRYDGSTWGVPSASATSINAQTGTTYTAAISDANNVITMDNAAANTVTIPPNSAVSFPVGCALEIWQAGAGQTTIAAGIGVTILHHAGLTLKLKGQHSGASLRKVAVDTWRLVGDMEAAP